MEEMENVVSRPVEGELMARPKPVWVRALLWTFVVLGGVYILNPTFGVDLLPDNMPILGNLDEAAILFLMLSALRYLGVHVPDFVDRLGQQAPKLPPAIEHRDA
jgi:uncharacterized membrane protein YkvA (DUF1232 family)